MRLQLWLWRDPLGQCWENSVHDADELVLIIEGGCLKWQCFSRSEDAMLR